MSVTTTDPTAAISSAMANDVVPVIHKNQPVLGLRLQRHRPATGRDRAAQPTDRRRRMAVSSAFVVTNSLRLRRFRATAG
jgi:hypothetical protein